MQEFYKVSDPGSGLNRQPQRDKQVKAT
ncbi:MAG TPA: CPBP family intramembrane metalloprotease, partial [Agrobacterium sp.]|nr:CPBP family intramembrane metalloprotease [Agrobacterium sp.]